MLSCPDLTLKHFICPIFILIHCLVVYKALIARDCASIPTDWGWPPRYDGDTGELSTWERHSLGIIGGSHLSMLAGHILGLTTEHGHFRAIMTLMELISWANGALDAYLVLGVAYEFAAVLAALAAVGLAVHSKEPGLLTKDKKASAADKTK